MDKRSVSIIVCTYNRAYAIVNSLEAIATAIKNTPSVECELVVVDNASTDNTSELISTWAKDSGVTVNLVSEPKKGLSRARNAAMRAAKGDLFIFTDDDCVMDADYINAALRHYAQDTELVMRGGRVELGDPTDLPITIKTDRDVQKWGRSINKGSIFGLAGALMGASMIFPRKIYEILGCFDEDMGAGTSIPSGEDTDYIYRAFTKNVLIEYIPDAVVYHFHGRKDKVQGYKLMSGYGQGNGALCAKYLFVYPDFCKQTYWDAKMLLRSFLKFQKYMYNPESGFTFNAWIKNTIIGFLKFVSCSMKRKFCCHD